MRSISEAQRATFLAYLISGNTVKKACEKSGVSRRSIYHLRTEDPDFAGAWEAAEAEGTDLLEEEVLSRALDREDPRSAQLLIFLLKKRNPAFKDSSGVTSTVKHETVHKYEFSTEEIATARKILDDAEKMADKA